ncbi:MAG: glutamate--tRNA ligase [candidate division Zixibacteria bacterium]|nr:glutamate--tRNA ligase [candidate division Zixibacteria bacterium]
MSEKEVRVRIAPSPSGYLHVGTARTAIFNWLYARNKGGKFLVRIEDTDLSRSNSEMIQPILDAMKWIGIDWDEEPVYQSKKIDGYGKYVDQLLESGNAYKCFCTPAELDERRKKAMAEKKPLQYNRACLHRSEDEIKQLLDEKKPFAIRIKIPDGETTYTDKILGDITRQNSEIEDLIICRANGRAIYNLAVVVDDHEMGITDVIRGNDHISNTFKQIHIYEALGLTPPNFAHVPLILRPDKKKVSKRLGDKDVAEYGAEGILPEAMFNFLCLLGWSPKNDREFLPIEKLKNIFILENVTGSNPIFNEEKLLALNGEYIRSYPDHELATMVAPELVKAGYTSKYWLETRWEYLMSIIGMLKERCKRMSDFVAMSEYFFHNEFEYDKKAVKKRFNPTTAERMKQLADKYETLDNFKTENIESALSGLAEELEIKKGELIHPVRLAVSGLSFGPSLYHMLEAIGKQEVIARMKKGIEFINKMEE